MRSASERASNMAFFLSFLSFLQRALHAPRAVPSAAPRKCVRPVLGNICLYRIRGKQTPFLIHMRVFFLWGGGMCFFLEFSSDRTKYWIYFLGIDRVHG